MKISKLEYVKMQVELFKAVYPMWLGQSGFAMEKMTQEHVDEILKLNGITVSDEPEDKQVAPMLEEDFKRFYYYNDDTAGYYDIVEELKKRGLVQA